MDKRTATLVALAFLAGGGSVTLVNGEAVSLADDDVLWKGDTAVAHALDLRPQPDGGVSLVAYGSVRDVNGNVADLGGVACEVPEQHQATLFGMSQANVVKDCARGAIPRAATFIHAVDLRRTASALPDGGADIAYRMEVYATDLRDGSTHDGAWCDVPPAGQSAFDTLALNCFRKGKKLGH